MKVSLLCLLSFLAIGVCNNSKAQHDIACLPKSKFQDSWELVGPFFDSTGFKNQHFGAISCISANPQKDSIEIYVGTPTGGLWYTNDGGKKWKNLTDSHNEAVLSVKSIFVDYSVTPHTIAIASADGGSPISGNNAGVLFSKNNGASWQASVWPETDYKLGMPPVTDLVQSKTNKNIWFAAVNNMVFRSSDNLKSFKKIFPSTAEHTQILNVPPAIYINQLLLHDASEQLFFTNRKLIYWNGKGVDDYRPTLVCIKNCLDVASRVDVKNLSDAMRANIEDWKSSEGMQLIYSDSKPNSIILLNSFEQQTKKGHMLVFVKWM